MSTSASANLSSASSQAQATTSTNASSSSSPSTTTTSAPTTSTTPATSATPTTTSQPSPAQTSAAAVTTTPSSSTPSTSTTSTAAPTTTSSSTFTTQVATTFSSTNSAGSVVYVTTTVPTVITTSISSSTGSSGTSNTGVIVGAVVGGVAGITILALLLFCIRRRVRKDEFDGNFDPDRIVGNTDGGGAGGTLPHVDLADEVTPFPQSYTDQGSSSMRQYSEAPYVAIPSSLTESGKASTDFYPPGAGASVDAQSRPYMQHAAGPPPSGAYLPPIKTYGTGPVDWHTPRPGTSPPPSTVSHNTTSTRAAKEREALGRGGQGLGLSLATPQEAAEGSGDVVVHQDAGRATVEEHAPPREIPPAYDSIRD